ncbi:MAG: ribosome small subunit-dependent GTPase A [Firmicutes bacterium]|nr:ribosome small subunit-dependent GTPase A [Bacillota bacterium]
MKTIDLSCLGLTEQLREEAKRYEGYYPGRVSSQAKDLFRVITEAGELTAQVSGKFRYQVSNPAEFPAVGDFVLVDRTTDRNGYGIIHHVLTRRSVFARKAAGETDALQIVATNIDTVFLCMALNRDFNLRRLERYLAIAWDSGATPVVVLTKADLCSDLEDKLRQVSTVAVGVETLTTSSLSADGYSPVKKYVQAGQTVAFIGSSGVGKSTLINRLLGEDIIATNETRNDGKGRHTTTRRELFILPEGGIVIDTPGMRELGIVGADLAKSFADIDEWATQCKFRDCTHGLEPGCAVQQAIKEGHLDADRLESYKKLQREAKYDGLNSKQIEKEKINEMFKGFGGIKNARKFIKEKKR